MEIRNYENTITTIDLMKFELHNPENQHIVEWLPGSEIGILATFLSTCCDLVGSTKQVIYNGDDTTPVEATTCPECTFVNWTCDSGYSQTEPVIVLSDVVKDTICMANYEIVTHVVDFVVGSEYYYYYPENLGYLVGVTHQLVRYMGTCLSVTAVPYPGHIFRYWKKNGVFYSYDATIAPSNIIADQTYTAYFI